MRPRPVPNCNRELANSAAAKGFRVSGRLNRQFRNPVLTFGPAIGACEVKYEPGTHVLAQISSSVGEPMDSRPGEGIMTVSVWVSPAATGEMGGGGKTANKSALIARTLEKIFKDHRVVDLESLCIKFGERVWVLRADIHIYDTNGCLQDASVLAMLGGLMTFLRPQAYMDRDTEKLVVHTLEDATPVSLTLNHLPLLTSFCITDDGNFLTEPDQEEEEMFVGKLMIALNESKEICFLQLASPIDHDVLTEATLLAQTKCIERIHWIKDLVGMEIERRSVPVYLRKKEEEENRPRTAGTPVDLSTLLTPTPTPETGYLNEHERSMAELSVRSGRKSTSKSSLKFKPIPADKIIMLES